MTAKTCVISIATLESVHCSSYVTSNWWNGNSSSSQVPTNKKDLQDSSVIPLRWSSSNCSDWLQDYKSRDKKLIDAVHHGLSSCQTSSKMPKSPASSKGLKQLCTTCCKLLNWLISWDSSTSLADDIDTPYQMLSAATAQCSQVECYGNNTTFDGNLWLLHVAEIAHSQLHAKHLQVTQSDRLTCDQVLTIISSVIFSFHTHYLRSMYYKCQNNSNTVWCPSGEQSSQPTVKIL